MLATSLDEIANSHPSLDLPEARWVTHEELDQRKLYF